MKERPILMSAPMVKAILAGTKTVTRRIVKTRNSVDFLGGRGEESDLENWGWFFDGPDHHGYAVLARGFNERHDHGLVSIPSPYGEAGDRLWVREEHYRFGHWEPIPGIKTKTGRMKWRFVADTDEVCFDAPASFRKGRHHKDSSTPAWHKRLARFMPRGLSRITLDVVSVRVERLHEITEEDARAEGVERDDSSCDHTRQSCEDVGCMGQTYHAAFADLWCEINGAESWDANPWIWRIEFRRVEGER